MFTRSIRWRLQLWHAFLLVWILGGFGITVYQLHRITRFNQIDEQLERRVSALSGDLRGRPPTGPPSDRGRFDRGLFDRGPSERGSFDRGPGSSPPRRGWDSMPPREGPPSRPEARDIQLSAQALSLFDTTDTNGYYYAIWSRGGTLVKHSPNAPADVNPPVRHVTDAGIHTRTSGTRREAFHFAGAGECILAGRTVATDFEAMRRFAWWLVAAGAGVLVFGLGGGGWLASRAIRPVEDISAAASRISAGNLSERINIADTDSELGRLGAVLNSTFARLEAAFAQQKQFTADASHELRTPISVIIAEAQTTMARERNAAEYRETIEVCLDAALKMKRLTQLLLELARFDAGQAVIERTRFDLAERTRACVELIRPLADARGIRIVCDLAACETLGDADRFCQVVINLLTNAVQYNKDQGEIRVTTRAQNGSVILTVADTGQGIVAADLPRVFERFYRGDTARGRQDGHSGLGLAISKAIVEAQGGSIAVSSRLGSGTNFTVRLPGG